MIKEVHGNKHTWKELLPEESENINEPLNWRLAFVFSFYYASWVIRPVARYVKRDGTLGHEKSLNFYSVLNSVEKSRMETLAMQLLKNLSRDSSSVDFYYGSEFGYILKYLEDSMLFYASGHKNRDPIEFIKESFEPILAVEEAEDQFILKLFLKNNETGQEIQVDDRFRLLSSGQAYFFADLKIWPVNKDVSAKILLPFCKGKNGLSIPKDEFDDFLIKGYPRLLSENVQVKLPEQIPLTFLDTIIGKALYLSEKDGELTVSVAFFYGGEQNPSELVKVEALPFETVKMRHEKDRYFLISRQKKAEEFFLKILNDHGLIQNDHQFMLPNNMDPIDWLYEELPKLGAKGFEILGEEKLDKLKVRRVIPQIITQVTSELDWFDLNVEIDFDGLRMSFQEVIKSLKKNKKFIRLNDGSAVKINDKILEKLGLLKTFADFPNENGTIRMAKSQALLIDEIIKDSTDSQTDSVFQNYLKKLQNFKQIKSVEIPTHFQGELRSYQKAGLDWLSFLNEFELGGCLADDMGLGKTVQALALLQAQKEQLKKNLVSLVVAPTSVIYNWQSEANKFTPDLKVYVHTGAERVKDAKHFENFDLIITSYALLWRDFEWLKTVSFYYIILDESQKIKNPLSITAKAAYGLTGRYRLVMTGTPIENNLTELWAQFQFINPGMLGSLNAFTEHYAKAIEKYGDKQKAEQLRRIIYPFILRRTKEMVVKELPPKVENTLFCNMNEEHKKYYEKWRDYYRALILKAIETKGLNRSKMKVLEGLTRLRQLAIHPAMVEKAYQQSSGKFEALSDLLEDVITENHKLLLFSQFVKALALVRKTLDEKQIPYLYLDGRTRNRQALVEQFQQNDNIKIFLISLKAGGLGLNLTAADYVIHLDPWWNPAVEAQAMDRAHRIGQTKKVFVYKLITKGTVEEKILQLQQKKKKLAEQLISTDMAFFKSLEKDDIVSLFS